MAWYSCCDDHASHADRLAVSDSYVIPYSVGRLFGHYRTFRSNLLPFALANKRDRIKIYLVADGHCDSWKFPTTMAESVAAKSNGSWFGPCVNNVGYMGEV